VSEPWIIWKAHQKILGVVAAILFAIVNADAVLTVNTELRGESPVSMTVAVMLAGTLLGAVASVLEGVFGTGEVNEIYTFSAPSTILVLALSLSFGMPLMLLFRNAGFALSRDTTVAQVRPISTWHHAL
jgi:hypothetical protein